MPGSLDSLRRGPRPTRARGGGLATVLVVDPRPARRARVEGAVTAARARVVHAWEEVASVAGSDAATVALVAVGTTSGETPSGVAQVRRLRHQGIPVLAYDDDVTRWPLRTRCQLLLAGALHVLDSATPGFVDELGGRLGQVLAIEGARRAEQDRLRALMAQLGVRGESPAMLDVFRRTVRISRLSDLPVLIRGETGTGKELLARAIHALDGKRARGAFVPLNCAALPRSLAESELFGHRRGAFSGADRSRKGLVRAADGGVLFLDEIGELDLDLQAKLLRVLQEGRVLAVGEDQEVPVDVRVVAATHRDLGGMVERGQFREDLFFRLAVTTLEIPPLRDRREDISTLVEHFVDKHARGAGGGVLLVGAEFIEALTHAALPGNIRQLENLVRRAIVQKEGEGALGLEDLPPEFLEQLSAASDAAPSPDPPAPDPAGWPRSTAQLLDASGWNLARALDVCERLLLVTAMERARGNQTRAARLLGITSRSVYNKIRKHQLGAGP